MPTHYKGKTEEVRALDAYVKLSRASGTLDARLAINLGRLGLTTGQLGVMEALMHLGPLSQGSLGGEAEDIQEPTQPSTSGAGGVAPKGTPSPHRRTAPDPESKASGPLRILRDHRQRRCVEAVPARGHRALEEMAWPTPSRRRSPLGADVPAAGALSAPASGCRPLGVPKRGESLK